MKIYTASGIKDWDRFTIRHEPVSSILLMERASAGIVEKIKSIRTRREKGLIICGTGNNGGDGLAVARLLFKENYICDVLVVGRVSKGTDDFKTNLARLAETEIEPLYIDNDKSLTDFEKYDYAIDALFGSGLNRAPSGIYASVIQRLNSAEIPIYSIDLPSGLLPDILEQHSPETIIKAKNTFAFQSPKIAFFLPENIAFTGKWEIIDIGLHKDYAVKSNWHYVDETEIREKITKRKNNAEKRGMGSALLVGGSKGMTGAVLLAARACLRSGSGLTTVYTSGYGDKIIQAMAPEAMCMPGEDKAFIQTVPPKLNFDSIGAGPGLGTRIATGNMLGELMAGYEKPMVLDADALNLIASRNLHAMIPSGSIITPHQREYERLFGTFSNADELLDNQLKNSRELNIYILLKGPCSRVTTPGGDIFVNSTGNPGMAKGGFGDVLTGIITSLLARYKNPETAAVLGMFLHGLAADIALEYGHEESLLPSDLIEALPRAFRKLDNH